MTVGMRKHICSIFIAIGLASPASAQGVLMSRNDPARSGSFIVPGLTPAAAATIGLDKDFSNLGRIAAQPLYWAPAKGQAELIVASQQDNVFALDPSSGAILWQRNLGTPLTGTQVKHCVFDFPLGVMSAGVIDPAAEAVYMNALTSGGHEIFGLSLADGSILSNFPLNVSNALADKQQALAPYYQYQRGGLALLHGHLIVAYGLNSCDYPGRYFGTVVEVDPMTASLTASWQSRTNGAGIWGQGGVTSDGKDLFVTTGNAKPVASRYGDTESVIRLRNGLEHSKSLADYWAPSNWHDLDKADMDLGATAAVPVDVPWPGNADFQVMVAVGKDGHAYILDRSNLGGVGGAALVLPISAMGLTAPAVFRTGSSAFVYVPTPSGMAAISLTYNGSISAKVAWTYNCQCFAHGATSVTTTDGLNNPIVWSQFNGGIFAVDGITGKQITVQKQPQLGGTSFDTEIFAGGYLWTVSGDDLLRFSFHF